MTVSFLEFVITSLISDVDDLPLDFSAQIDAAELSRYMRLIEAEDGGPVTTLVAFNSSI
jgi:hypothetical protein